MKFSLKEKQSFLAFGKTAESEALLLAKKMGGAVLAQNVRFKQGELDLVFERPGDRGGVQLVFAEIRSRNSNSPWGWNVEEMIREPKVRRFKSAAKWFLAFNYRGIAQEVVLELWCATTREELDASEAPHFHWERFVVL